MTREQLISRLRSAHDAYDGPLEQEGHEIRQELIRLNLGIEAVAWILDAMVELPHADFGEGGGPLGLYCIDFYRKGLESVLIAKVLEMPSCELLAMLDTISGLGLGISDPTFKKPTHEERLQILQIFKQVATTAADQGVRDAAYDYSLDLKELMTELGESFPLD